MSTPDPFTLTRYRVAQHWRFKSVTPEASDVLCITSVEFHPTQGILIGGWVEYEPAFPVGGCSYMSGVTFEITQDAMDRSAAGLVAEKGLAPSHLLLSGEFQRTDEFWGRNPGDRDDRRTVGEIVEAQTAEYRDRRDTWVEPAPDPRPTASLGLWSLIEREEVGRLRELFEQHPSLVSDPLPDDEDDEYCYAAGDDEFRDCPPLFLAAFWGKPKLARLLLDLGADPRAANASGETALHFAGRSHTRSDTVADVIRVLCAAGADPVAKDGAGRTPMTCGYCMDCNAAALHEFGAPLTLNHAVRLKKPDEARRILRENPRAVRDAPMPGEVIDDVVHLIVDEAARIHGREFRLADGETPEPGEDGWPDRLACRVGAYQIGDDGISDDPREKAAEWSRHADIERAVFEQYRDILDAMKGRGADPNGTSALWYASQMYGTAVAEWLFANGGTPVESQRLTTEYAKTHRMRDLLRRHGIEDEKYPRQKEDYEIERDEFEAEVRDLLDPPPA